jgi:subtilase family serine protease
MTYSGSPVSHTMWVLALVAVVAMGAFASGAGAALTPNVPHAVIGTQNPPTTAQCIALTGDACYSPVQLRRAYRLGALYREGHAGQERTIVIVNSFGSPTIRSDLSRFDRDLGLPDPPSLRVIAPAGPVPPYNPQDADRIGWAIETSLDVEWAHAVAPQANILLVETPVSETQGVQGFPEIVRSEDFVIDHDLGDVISQSFGSAEAAFPNAQSLLALRHAFFNALFHGVTVLGASGDFGSIVVWPSSDPLVTSVGGTQLHLDATGRRTAPDNVWNDGHGASGGGPSQVFRHPIFQFGVRTGAGAHRATPDISMSAAVNGGVIVYVSAPGFPPGYSVFGGTSEATPLFAGIVAIADQIAGHRLGWINPSLYRLPRRPHPGLVDITTGNNTFIPNVPGFTASPGYDMASGLGTLDAYRFAHALAGRPAPPSHATQPPKR